jgi:hypothetical protein
VLKQEMTRSIHRPDARDGPLQRYMSIQFRPLGTQRRYLRRLSLGELKPVGELNV